MSCSNVRCRGHPAIASAPPSGDSRHIARRLDGPGGSRRENALAPMSTIVSLGSVQENIDSDSRPSKERGRSGGCGEAQRGRAGPVTTPRALLIDIDGVLVVSWEALPGARRAFDALRAANVPLRFLADTTRAPRPPSPPPSGRDSRWRRTKSSLPRRPPPRISPHTSRRARCLLLNSGDDITEDLPGVTLVGPETLEAKVDTVIVGGAGPEFSYDTLNQASPASSTVRFCWPCIAI